MRQFKPLHCAVIKFECVMGSLMLPESVITCCTARPRLGWHPWAAPASPSLLARSIVSRLDATCAVARQILFPPFQLSIACTVARPTFARDTLARYALLVAFLVAPRRNKDPLFQSWRCHIARPSNQTASRPSARSIQSRLPPIVHLSVTNTRTRP